MRVTKLQEYCDKSQSCLTLQQAQVRIYIKFFSPQQLAINELRIVNNQRKQELSMIEQLTKERDEYQRLYETSAKELRKCGQVTGYITFSYLL